MAKFLRRTCVGLGSTVLDTPSPLKQIIVASEKHVQQPESTLDYSRERGKTGHTPIRQPYHA